MFRWPAPNLPLLGVLLLALVLRVWGLGWGLPSATHYFSYHPDESQVMLVVTQNMNLFRGHLLPHFYNYGSLQLYLVLFANAIVYLFGGEHLAITDYAMDHAQWARMFLVGRCLTAGMGVGTVWAVQAIGARLWGRRAGLLAAGILAIMPLHTQHSHWLTVDVPATFWATLSLLWAVRLATGDPKPMHSALAAGVFAGLAAATKYNLALAVLPLALAALVPLWERGREGRWRLALRRLGLGLGASIFAFFAACPGVLLEHRAFWHDFRYEAYHVRYRPEPMFQNTGSGFVYHVTRNLDAGLGLPLLLLCLVAVGYALWRRERGDGLLAAFALPYYVLIGLAAVRYARYVIPLLPILSLWTGRLLADASRLPHPVGRKLAVTVSALVLLFTAADAAWLVQAMAEPDPRDRALAWLNAHTPAPVPVGFATKPWYDAPPVSPWFCLPFPGYWRQFTAPETQARIVYDQDWDAAALPRAPFVVLTEYGVKDALRLHDPQAAQYLRLLRQGYKQAADFEHGGLDGRRQDLPHDMAYPSPAIEIYQRK